MRWLFGGLSGHGQLLDAFNIVFDVVDAFATDGETLERAFGQRVTQSIVVRLAANEIAFAENLDADRALAVGSRLLDSRCDNFWVAVAIVVHPVSRGIEPRHEIGRAHV